MLSHNLGGATQSPTDLAQQHPFWELIQRARGLEARFQKFQLADDVFLGGSSTEEGGQVRWVSRENL
jgi:hypothetical protein